MSQHDVLAIGLDGFDIGYGTPLIDSGELPVLAGLRDRSRTFLLDHGAAARTGLAWEHFATGMTPERAAERASMVELVDHEYDATQRGTRLTPFFSSLDRTVVVFDPPYTDIARAPRAQGVVGWGAHDPGVSPTTSPPELRGELDARFGPYPSSQWLYVSPWPSAPLTADTGTALVRALGVRRDASRWLLSERFTEWDLAIVVASEPHSAAEAFWHGVDPAHPLHDRPSAAEAARWLTEVYRAADRLVGDLIEATAPRHVLIFSMGGMGSNNSDIPSMVLLPELLYRWSTGRTLLDVPREWTEDPTQVPILSETQKWDDVLATCYPSVSPAAPRTLRRQIAARLPSGARELARHVSAPTGPRLATVALEWMPATRYRALWPTMRAFALPAFYDGRIRVNLRGREPAGIVDPADYNATCDELEELLGACLDPRTGAPLVAHIERPDSSDPFALRSTYADLTVAWGDPACGLTHPQFGLVGPVPYKRTGGHTAPYGFAWVSGGGVEVGDGGIRSAFDVSPTIASLLDATFPAGLDGRSLLGARV